MKHTIPSSKIWRQPNRDEYSGELFATKGVDLTSSPGKVRPARALLNVRDNADDAQLQFPVAFVRSAADTTDRWWALCHTVLFKTGSPSATDFTQDAITSTPTDLDQTISDLVEFNGSLIASKSTDLYKLTAGTWTATWWTGAGNLNQAALTSVQHPLFVGFTNQLIIGDGRYVHTVDINNKVRNRRLTFKPEYRVRWIRGNSSSYFIGADHIYGGTGKVFEWDGSSENFTREYEVQTDISFACAVKNEIPYVFNRNGQLLRYNGGGFSEVARLPIAHVVYDTTIDAYGVTLNDGSSLNVRSNGMDIIDGNVHIALNGGLNGGTVNFLDSANSGIYEYDERIGLYNKYAFSKYKSGDRTDFGGGSIYRSGALKNLNDHQFFVGMATYTDIATTERHAILTPTNAIENRGHIITPRIQTSEEVQNWQRVWLKHRLKTSTDKLIVKYRTDDNLTSNFRAAITWVNTTSFTGISGVGNCIGNGDWSTAQIGDEITVMRGHGTGVVAHITAISLNAGDYTITIDETLAATATTTAWVYVRNWTKLGTVTNTSDNPISFPLYPKKSWIQFKVELRGLYDGCELEELQVISEDQIKNLS